MNFLTICQRTREVCGISGSGPTTTVSQTGEMLRIVNWVIDAWRDVQLWQPWGFMEAEFSFQTTAGVREYTSTAAGITQFGNWVESSLRAYLTSTGQSGEQFLTPLEYWWFRDVYQFGGMNLTQGRPIQFTIRPEDQALLLGPIPNDIYTVYGKYHKSPQIFAADSDTPTGLQEQYHMMIVYRAAMKYAMYENAPETLAEARSNYQFMLDRLSSDWLPDMTVPSALA